jgi:transposase
VKYDFVFKINSVELYRNGQWPDTPEGINQKDFRKCVRTWAKLADLHGMDALRHPTTCKEYTAEERYKLVARVLAGESQKSVAISAGINDSQLSKWVKQYKIYGYDGLNLKKGRRSKEISMKNADRQKELTISEREELIRLRAETEYLRTENEAIKKLIALRQEKKVAQLKAKKQQSQKNSEKKDIN